MERYNLSPETDIKVSSQTNEQLEALNLVKTPINYEVWYAYYANLLPDLTNTINKLIQTEQKFSNDLCQELYQNYIHQSEKEQQLLEKTGDQIQSSLHEIQELLGDVKKNASDYSGSLQDVSTDLSKADSIEAISNVVKNILTQTKSMVEQNNQLEQKLASSSSQIQELQSTLDVVRKESLTDGLTGISNRKSFDERIQEEIKLSEKEHTKLSLLMIDIDFFKSFNDNYGHQTGDQVLKLVAHTLINGVKGRDMAARYGGEEFAILLPETPLSAAKRVADGLRERIANKEIINRATGVHLGQITISVGVSEHQKGENVDSLVERADKALYKAKELGRNRVEVSQNPYISLQQNV